MRAGGVGWVGEDSGTEQRVTGKWFLIVIAIEIRIDWNSAWVDLDIVFSLCYDM